MAMRVNMHEAKTNLSKLVAALESGEEDTVEIARAGKVVAKLVPQRPADISGVIGMFKGQIWIADDFDELDEETAAAFRGERP